MVNSKLSLYRAGQATGHYRENTPDKTIFFTLCDPKHIKLQSSLTVQFKAVRLGVDFLSLSQQLTNPYQNLPEGSVL